MPVTSKSRALGSVLLLALASLALIMFPLHTLEKPTIDRVSVFLALVALAVAITDHFHIKSIVRSRRTRYIGVFPGCVSGVANVVEAAKDKLDILADHCGYGFFSKPNEFNRYFVEIERKAMSRVPVRTMIYDEALERRCHANSFQGEWEKTKNSRKFREFFAEETPPTKWEEFNDRLVAKEKTYREHLIGVGVQLRLTLREALVFLWISDREAAFSFRTNVEGRDEEVAFATKDPQLIEILSKVFQTAWDAKPAVPLAQSN